MPHNAKKRQHEQQNSQNAEKRARQALGIEAPPRYLPPNAAGAPSTSHSAPPAINQNSAASGAASQAGSSSCAPPYWPSPSPPPTPHPDDPLHEDDEHAPAQVAWNQEVTELTHEQRRARKKQLKKLIYAMEFDRSTQK